MKIAKPLVCFFLLLSFSKVFAQGTCPTWNWVDSISPYGNYNYSYPRLKMESDSVGNLYVLGSFYSFQPLIFGQDTLTTTYPNRSYFLAKRDTNRVWVWGEQFDLPSLPNSPGYSTAHDFVLSKSGLVTITGVFDGQASFGPLVISDTLDPNANLFVARFDVNNRQWLWAKKASSANDIEGLEVAVDDTGNSYITGFANALDTGQEASFGNLKLSYDSTVIFLAKISSTGNWEWVRAVTYPPWWVSGVSHNPYQVTVDPMGNPVVGGVFKNQITVNGQTVYDSSQQGGSLYVIKFQPNGNPLWLQTARSDLLSFGLNLGTDSKGHIYVISGFHLSISFGPYALYTPWPKQSTCVAKLAPNGQWISATKVVDGNVLQWNADFSTTDNNGSSYITGNARPDSFCGKDSLYGNNFYVIKIDSSGNSVWEGGVGGNRPSSVIVGDLTSDKKGNLYLIGYNGQNSFIGLKSLRHPGSFIAKIRPDSVLSIGLPNDTLLYCGDSLEIITNTSNVSNLCANWSPSHGLNDSTALHPVASPDSTTTYTLVVTTIGGCSATAQITIFKDSSASYIGAIDVNPSTGSKVLCSNTPMTLSTPGNHPYYFWGNGDTTASISVTKPGNYSLTVIDSNGCYISGSVEITSLVSIDAPNVLLCAKDSVRISATGKNLDSLRWNAGSSQPQLYIRQPGWYWVTGYKGACEYTDSVEVVSFTDTANARFTFTANGLDVNFNPISVGVIQAKWDFGDGALSSVINPLHTYLNPGTYEVCLEATDVCGYTSQECDSVIIALVSLQEVENEPLFTVYPNPTDGTVWIEGENRSSSVVQVMSLSGRILLKRQLEEGRKWGIDISHLATGYYLLQIGGFRYPLLKK